MNLINGNGKKVFGTIIDPFQKFFRIEASGGIVLLIATIAALFLANSGFKEQYYHIWEYVMTLKVAGFEISHSFHHWINDALMVIFFFVVGLEIKREITAGELSTFKQAALPIFSALGGMILPALLFLLLNDDERAGNGWGIPMATDIAFSLGILSLLGRKVPLSLKVFLVAFAIVDDLGAVVVIALFYNSEIQIQSLITGVGLYVFLLLLNRLNFRNIPSYLFIGIIMWFFFLDSGIHPTIAGVLLAFSIPVRRKIRLGTFRENMERNLESFCIGDARNKLILTKNQVNAVSNMQSEIRRVQSPVQYLEHDLHRFVTYIIMPLFAFANAGIFIGEDFIGQITRGLSFDIQTSLVFGKVLGIFLFAWISVKIGLSKLPKQVRWSHIFGAGLLGGLGFTMSMFISNLAFNTPETASLQDGAKMGILMGSLIAGVTGYLFLFFILRKTKT